MNELHENHRKRMKEKYERYGEDVFDTHQLLEMLMYAYVTRVDTNPAAHSLLRNFGGMKLFSAETEELKTVNGVGSATADGLRISLDTVRRIMCDGLEEKGLDNDFKIRTYCYLKLLGKPYECVYRMVLSKRNRVIEWVPIPEGVRADSAFVKELARSVISVSGNRLILCHSHGEESATPSVEDLYITEYLSRELFSYGISLEDQYVITTDNCVSCKEIMENSKKNTKGE